MDSKRVVDYIAKNMPMSPEEIVFSEGQVSSAKTEMIRTLNNAAMKIGDKAEAFGLKPDVFTIDDVTEIANATSVTIQFGQNKHFKLSQSVEFTVYDSDDIVVEVPIAMSKKFDIPPYHPMSDVSEALKLLGDIVKRTKGE